MRRVFPVPRLISYIFFNGIVLLILLTVLRIGFFLFFDKHGTSTTAVGKAFFLGFRFDLRAIAIILLLVLVFGSIPPVHPFRSNKTGIFWIIFLTIAVLFILFFYTFDFTHYSYLSQRLNASVLNYLQDFGISVNMVWQSYPVIWILLGIFAAMIAFFFLFRSVYKRIRGQQAIHSKKKKTIAFAVTFLLLAMFIFGKAGQYPLRWSDAFSLGNDYVANLALNPFESFFNTLRFREKPVTAKELHPYFPVLGKYYPFTIADSISFYRKTGAVANKTKRSPNVVVIICESFSAYKSSMWGNPLNTTPFFDSLSRKGIFFDHCFTPTYGTARGIWAIVTGIPDVVQKSTASRNPAAVDQHTIINDFSGYEKYYFLGGSSSWANIRGLLTNNIQDLHLYEQQDFKAPKLDVWGISDKNLLMEAASILGKERAPFFAVIQTADNHRPYSIPDEDLDEFQKVRVAEDTLTKYGFESLAEMNAFRYTDFSFRKFMEVAAAQPYFNETLFVFIGDHGIPGNAQEMFPSAWTGQRLSALHVPLLFFGRMLDSTRRITKIVSQIDLLPTIAGLTGIAYTNSTLGRDVLNQDAGQDFAFIFDPDMKQYGVVKNDHLLRINMETKMTEMVPVIKNPVHLSDDTQKQMIAEMKELSDALYLSSGFLILHNNKQKVQRP
ncbi:MAG TPA: LTA synthase family protein [Flavitalea sp.]|nr:LTA synthase family protein [Flavitalea sp.]